MLFISRIITHFLIIFINKFFILIYFYPVNSKKYLLYKFANKNYPEILIFNSFYKLMASHEKIRSIYMLGIDEETNGKVI